MYAVAPDMVTRFETIGGVAISSEADPPPSSPYGNDRGWNRFLIGPTRAELKEMGNAIPPSVLSGPQAFLVGRKDEGATFHPHYHPVNQFQVVLRGGGCIGKRPLAPGSFHYADANTPYGPIVTGPDGLEFMTVRQQLTNISVHMPGGRAGTAPPGRNIVAHAGLEPRDGPVVQNEVVPTHPDGLRVLSIHLHSGASYVDDDLTRASRQYVLVMSGSVRLANATFGEASVFFTEPGEVLGSLMGVNPHSTLLVLRFPSQRNP